jgi:acetylserotonin N-methyltransferase
MANRSNRAGTIISVMIDPQPVIELIYAFRRSKTMFAAVELGVFDRLQQGPASAASFPELDPGAAERLLDGCVSLGLLAKQDGVYRNTPVAERYLCRSSPETLAGYVLYSNAALFPMWAHLEDAIREGTSRWEPTFGFPAGGIFDHFFNTPAAKRDFLLGMHGFGRLSSPKVVAAFDLSRFRRMVDLGGATGHLAMAAREAYPEMSAAVFDLPRAIEFVREFAAGRVELIAGDFFEDPLPPADLYAVGRILHDWAEVKIERLLARVHAALPPGGGLLIAEMLLDDDKCGPVDADMQSLNMLVCTEGRERTLTEYRALVEAAGFTDVEGRRTGAPLDAVLALKSR